MKLRTLLITLPIVIVLVALAVANRAPVRLSLDPFGGTASGYAVEMPLFLALFAALLVGVLIGGTVAWGAGLRRRRRLRISNVDLKRDLDRARTETAAAKPADAVAQLPAPQ